MVSGNYHTLLTFFMVVALAFSHGQHRRHTRMGTAAMISTLATLGALSLPLATCLPPSLDVSIQACSTINPDDYFKNVIAKAGNGGQAGTLRGKPTRFTLILVPRQIQPSPALQPSLDLRIDLSSFLDVKTALMKRPQGSSAITPVIDRDLGTVTWNNIGAALLGAGSRKAVPQKLRFTIKAVLASDIPKGIKIKAYLLDDQNVCEVMVGEEEVLVRDPEGFKAIRSGEGQ